MRHVAIQSLVLMTLPACVIPLSTNPVLGQSTWALPTGGVWHDPLNWQGSVPNGVGDIAIFGPSNPTGHVSITLGQLTTVGEIVYETPRNVTLTGVGPLVFEQSLGATPQINVQSLAGNQLRVETPVRVADGMGLSADVTNGVVLQFAGPLISDGALTKTGHGSLVISGDNTSFNGLLEIDGGMVLASGDSALGASGLPGNGTIVRDGASLQLLSQNISEGIVLDGGALRIGDLMAPRPPSTLSGPISIPGSADALVELAEVKARFEGGLTGHGLNLILAGSAGLEVDVSPITLSGDLTIQNDTGDRPVFNSGVTAETLRYKRLNSRNPFPAWFFGDSSFGRIVIEAGGVLAEGQVSSRNPDLEIWAGELIGRISGITQVHKTTSNQALIVDQSDVAYHVKGGVARIVESDTQSTSTIHIDSTNFATATIVGSLNSDILLDNAQGFPYAGALSGRSSGAVVYGNVELGDAGAVISGHWDGLTLSGDITGGSMKFIGPRRLKITSDASYTGATVIGHNGEPAVLQIVGSISHSPDVIINRQALLNASPIALHPQATVTLRGGILVPAETGTFHNIHAQDGLSFLVTGPNKEVTIANLQRDPQAVFAFDNASISGLGGSEPDSPRVFFASPPDQTNGILGGWAYFRNDFSFYFTTYDAQFGVRPLSDTNRPSQVAGASPSDNVLLGLPFQPLSEDTEINSLHIPQSVSSTLNLGGNQLVIGTGGLISNSPLARINDGSLTSGSESLYLISRSSLDVGANITDGPNGPIAVVLKGNTLTLRGTNTYTGPTVLLDGEVRIPSAQSIPAESDLILHGGTLDLDLPPSSTVRIGTLQVRDGAELIGAEIEAAAYELESGRILSPLAGSATIHKRSNGAIQANLTKFQGDIVVHEGLLENLAFAGTSGWSHSAPVHVAGGHVLVSVCCEGSTGALKNDWVFERGSFSVRESRRTVLQGKIHVVDDFSLLTFPSTYDADFESVDPSYGDIVTDGDMTLANNVTLSKLGEGMLNIRGKLFVGKNNVLHNDDGVLRLSGTLISNSPDASLDIKMGSGSNELTASIELRSGDSLQLLRDSSHAPIALKGNSVFSGMGTLQNDIELSSLARVSPGGSLGRLDVAGSLTLGPLAHYEWEINDATGLPGAPSGAGWDTITAESIVIAASESEPVRLTIRGLNAQDELGPVAGFNPTASYTWPLIISSDLAGFHPAYFDLDVADIVSENSAQPEAFQIIASEGNLVLSYAPVAVSGDYNTDGMVNAADYTTWRDKLGSPEGTLPNDTAGGVVGQSQYDAWKANFGMTAGSATAQNAAVPEPVSLLLVLKLAIMGLCCQRRLARSRFSDLCRM